MGMIPVRSDAIAAIGYDPQTRASTPTHGRTRLWRRPGFLMP